MKEFLKIWTEPFTSGEFSKSELWMGAVAVPLVLVVIAWIGG